MIHSKVQWIELGEKPTKYFFQLESKRQSRNSITEQRVNNSSVSTLYTAEPVDFENQDWLLNQLDTALTANDQHHREGELMVNECFEAASQLLSNKSPGSDSLPVEFYRCFWSFLGPDLVATLNYSDTYGSVFYLRKIFPSSLRTGVLFRYLRLITRSVS